MTLLLAILFLILAVGCRAISELANHGKLKWSKNDNSFWGHDSYIRKYKLKQGRELELAPTTYYYKFFNLKYKERFPGSATFLVLFTDGYHLMQFWMFNFLSVAFTLAVGWNWWIFGGMMIGVRLIHGTIYKFLQR